MKDLLTFILSSILPESQLNIIEEQEDGKVNLKVEAGNDVMGILIGKGGRTIKAIQDIIRVRGRLDGKNVFVNVVEKAS